MRESRRSIVCTAAATAGRPIHVNEVVPMHYTFTRVISESRLLARSAHVGRFMSSGPLFSLSLSRARALSHSRKCWVIFEVVSRPRQRKIPRRVCASAYYANDLYGSSSISTRAGYRRQTKFLFTELYFFSLPLKFSLSLFLSSSSSSSTNEYFMPGREDIRK